MDKFRFNQKFRANKMRRRTIALLVSKLKRGGGIFANKGALLFCEVVSFKKTESGLRTAGISLFCIIFGI